MSLAKGVLVLFSRLYPFLTRALVYLIVRVSGIGSSDQSPTDAKKHFDDYVREQAHASPSD